MPMSSPLYAARAPIERNDPNLTSRRVGVSRNGLTECMLGAQSGLYQVQKFIPIGNPGRRLRCHGANPRPYPGNPVSNARDPCRHRYTDFSGFPIDCGDRESVEERVVQVSPLHGLLCSQSRRPGEGRQ